MANTKNLKPFNNDGRTESEQREIQRKGGKTSGEVRRTRRTIRDTMELLLAAPLSADETSELEKYGLDGAELDRRAALAVGIYKRAVEGDCKAFALISDMIGEQKQTQEEKDIAEKNNEQTNAVINSLLSSF
ncbi:hypothetical protein FACS189425_04820 [Clostridia bacterium]|nr:hypothetical protein FACS189425_04820 [Clostridia bacterium]